MQTLTAPTFALRQVITRSGGACIIASGSVTTATPDSFGVPPSPAANINLLGGLSTLAPDSTVVWLNGYQVDYEFKSASVQFVPLEGRGVLGSASGPAALAGAVSWPGHERLWRSAAHGGAGRCRQWSWPLLRRDDRRRRAFQPGLVVRADVSARRIVVLQSSVLILWLPFVSSLFHPTTAVGGQCGHRRHQQPNRFIHAKVSSSSPSSTGTGCCCWPGVVPICQVHPKRR